MSVEDVVILEKEEIVGVVQAIDAVHLLLEEVPMPVKLVDGQGWLELRARLPSLLSLQSLQSL